ncbi:MAG: ABC-2 transporter permease [Turicibacter sp.]
MLGLMLKDLLNLRKTGRSLFFILIFYTIFFFTMDSGALSGVLVVLVTMQVLTTFSYDEYAKWDAYALSLPVSRQQLVKSKYVLSYLFVLFGTILSFILTSVVSIMKGNFLFMEMLASVGAVGFIFIMMLLIILPLIYKFGIEKSRMLMFVVMGLPTLLIFTMAMMGMPMPSEQTLNSLLRYLPIIIPVVLVVVTYVSYQLSVKVVMKKEY